MLYCIAILLPILGGCFILTGAMKTPRQIKTVSLALVAATTLAALWAVFSKPEAFTLITFIEGLSLTFEADGLSRIFATVVSVLWVPTMMYAWEYMKHEGGERRFFGFFVMSFGVVLGIALARNFFTLYVFYEYLTFSTLPLVMHQMDGKARFAARRYLLYMVSGGALAFVVMLVLMRYGVSLDFVMGGVLDPAKIAGHETLLRVMFLVGLLGFGVKAAIFPMHRWLPTASVAPTPVTALLHAVAVVKSGVFAIARLTFYSYGVGILRGSFAQAVMQGLAILTILIGSTMALRESHLKRRLAYSTISNLSYIVFGLSLMSTQGLTGAMLHLVMHATLKIVLFFCAGAILYKTGIEYVADLKGLGRRMPIICACYTIASIGVVGVPPFAAFYSKYLMATDAAAQGSPLALLGVAALLVSELLTAMYLFIPALNFYFAAPGEACERLPEGPSDPNRWMTVPIALLALATLLLALCFRPLGSLIASLL